MTTSRNADEHTANDASGAHPQHDAAQHAERISRNPVLKAVARLGYATSGLLQLLIGVLAVQVALHGGGGGRSTDQSGALADVADSPGGAIVLWIGVIGSLALALWYLVKAVLEQAPDAKDRWKERASDLGKTVIYAVVGFTALRFALGSGSSSSSGAQNGTAKILDLPGGQFLVALIGLAVIALGGYLVHKGWIKGFTKDIDVPSGSAGGATIKLGLVGYIARGLAVGVVGILFVVAGFTTDPGRATGLDGALKAFADLPFGKVVLLAIALGWVASGVYAFVRAARARMR